jgi:PadR family transcriptional regulator PadR
MVSSPARRPDVESAWVRASLDLAILAALTEADRHGYALAQRLADLGMGVVRGGVLYPVLNRLESEAVVCSSWQAGEGGPGRKVYAITEDGRRRLTEQRASWRRFAATFERFLEQTMEQR